MRPKIPHFNVIFISLLCWVSSLVGIEKPNIVVILADDLGLGDVGREHTARTGTAPLAPTPNIDALANEGLWFTDAHSPAALCAPTRFAVMTGKYNYRSYQPGGVWGTFDLNAIATTDTTLGSLAKSAGYTTGFVGKWHLGGDFYATGTTNITRQVDENSTPAQVDMTTWVGRGPQNLGFDYDFTVACGVQGPTYVAHENGSWYPWEAGSTLVFYNNANFVEKGPGIGDSNWDATELNMLLADKAAAFIASSASGSAPFMLYYCSPAVHLPHTPPVSIDGETIAGTTPSAHLDMNRVLDLEVKKIVDALKAAGEYENTLILFTSDNGGLYDTTALSAGHNSSGGYRGTKNTAFEGGQRVPFIAVWPSVIDANTTSNALVNGTDILATIAETMEASFPDTQALDSQSIFPLFLGNSSFTPRTELMQQGGNGNELMFRQGDWKLIIQSTANHNSLTQADTTATKLFNLSDNPNEADGSNLINDPAQASRVTSMYNRYWEIRGSTDRTAPSYGATINTSSTLFSEDFSSMTNGDTVNINSPVKNTGYDTDLDTSNHAVAAITTNVAFGDGNVLQASTGPTSVLTQGFGSISNKNSALPVTLNVGDKVTLAFDMLVQAVPATTDFVNIELRMTGATKKSRTFTELTGATIGDTVSFSWTVDVDSDMANASDLYFWIPIEGIASNFDTEGPNGNGTDLNVIQLDNITLTQTTSAGYQEFANDNSLSGSKTSDDDGDSLSNVLEYALGSDPTNSSSARNVSTQIIENSGSKYMEVQYSRRKSANNFSALRIWRTTDLANPNWELGTTQVISVTDDSNDNTVENVVERSLFSTQATDKAFYIMDVVVAP